MVFDIIMSLKRYFVSIVYQNNVEILLISMSGACGGRYAGIMKEINGRRVVARPACSKCMYAENFKNNISIALDINGGVGGEMKGKETALY